MLHPFVFIHSLWIKKYFICQDCPCFHAGPLLLSFQTMVTCRCWLLLFCYENNCVWYNYNSYKSSNSNYSSWHVAMWFGKNNIFFYVVVFVISNVTQTRVWLQLLLMYFYKQRNDMSKSQCGALLSFTSLLLTFSLSSLETAIHPH